MKILLNTNLFFLLVIEFSEVSLIVEINQSSSANLC